MSLVRNVCIGLTALTVAAAVPITSPAAPPPGMRWSDHAGLQGSEWRSTPRPAPSTPYVYPSRSQVTMFPLPQAQATPYPQQFSDPYADRRAYVMAHLPEGAELLIEGEVMVDHASKPVHELRSPPLEKGMTYHYTARVRWFEDGKWVTQEHTFNFKVGDVHCIDIIPSNAPELDKQIKTALGKLPHAERTAAESQKFCAVQDTIRLGSMGAPVKVSVSGKDVFLCCEGCRKAALKDPAKTAATAEANKSKPLSAEDTKPKS